MPAAIASNGTIDLFASHRVPAWHGLGNVFEDEVTDYMEMLRLAGLDNMDVREMEAPLPAGVSRFVTPTKHIVANLGGEVVILGTTGERYKIVQNEDAFAFLQSLQDGASWETAGALKGGRLVFGSMAFERDFVIDPSGVADAIKSYLLVYTSHDGSTGVAGGTTPIRVVCQNTLNVALKGVEQTFKIRHTSNVAERMLAAAALWREANSYMDVFEVEAKNLFEKSVTDKEFFGIVEGFFPKPEKDVKGAVKKWEKRQELFTQAWNGKPNAGIKNTGWGALNALTEANQWGRNIRNTASGEENFFAAGTGFDTPTNVFRNKALAAVKAL